MQKDLEKQKNCTGNQRTVLKPENSTGEPEDNVGDMLEKQFCMVKRKLQTVINEVSDSTKHAAVMIGKPSTFKIPTFDGTGPRELCYKQFEATAVHKQWTNSEKRAALKKHLKRPAQQM